MFILYIGIGIDIGIGISKDKDTGNTCIIGTGKGTL